jgi:hypothetical protein
MLVKLSMEGDGYAVRSSKMSRASRMTAGGGLQREYKVILNLWYSWQLCAKIASDEEAYSRVKGEVAVDDVPQICEETCSRLGD